MRFGITPSGWMKIFRRMKSSPSDTQQNPAERSLRNRVRQLSSVLIAFRRGLGLSLVADFVSSTVELPFDPIFAKDFHRMLCADGAVAAAKVFGRAVFVTAPTDSFGMLRMQRELRHISTVARTTSCHDDLCHERNHRLHSPQSWRRCAVVLRGAHAARATYGA